MAVSVSTNSKGTTVVIQVRDDIHGMSCIDTKKTELVYNLYGGHSHKSWMLDGTFFT